MGCSLGSKFTCILSLGPACVKRVPVNLPTWLDVRERLFDERVEVSRHGDSPNHRLRRVWRYCAALLRICSQTLTTTDLSIAATRHQDAIDAGLDREIQQMADVADQLVTTLEKTVEELRRRAGVPPYDPANAYTLGALVAAPAPAPDFDAQLAAALASVPPPPGPPAPLRGVQ